MGDLDITGHLGQAFVVTVGAGITAHQNVNLSGDIDLSGDLDIAGDLDLAGAIDITCANGCGGIPAPRRYGLSRSLS